MSADPRTLYLGLISGTSADGIDAALVRFDDDDPRARCELMRGKTFAWDAALRARLVELGQGGDIHSLDELGTLDVRIAEAFADAALALLREADVAASDVRALGSHGQTVRHRPHGSARDGSFPFTMQFGDGNLIAERTGITTIADFRRRDIAAGGHGAPLLPALHAALLSSNEEDRAVLNLGGIANLTLLAPGQPPRGFDTGPANVLLDAWCRRHTGQAFDADGRWAAGGRVDAALLQALIASEPWLQLPPPKSTGRDLFNAAWLDARLAGWQDKTPADVQATARHHGVAATIVPGLAHMLMLERQWEKAAREIARWLATL